MSVNLDDIRKRLTQHSQEQLLEYSGALSEQELSQLLAQIDDVDFDLIDQLNSGTDAKLDFAAMAAAATAPPAVHADGSGADWTPEQARIRGEEALRAGQVAAVLVAGGQGTRLGFDKPKGMYPIGPVSERTLFQFFADRLLAVQARYGREIPLYIMTSAATDATTREYFQSNDFLGLNPEEVRIFQQGTMPAVDSSSGKILLAGKDTLALSPDGHGGTVRALKVSGCLDDAKARGIQHLAYFQVDNPLVALCDPELIGHHLMADSEMTTQVVRKRYPMERVGNVVLVDGKVQIIEYSDLPESAAVAEDDQGQLRLWAGNIAVHVIDRGFMERMNDSVDALPFHRASKKVPYLGPDGNRVEPDAPNATKFERFIFDLLPLAKNAFVVEAMPQEAFAPVKNADGADADTPELARRAISDLHRDWLMNAGIHVDDGILVEINPRFALDPSEIAMRIPAESKITEATYFDL